jgi:hypothetical protein
MENKVLCDFKDCKEVFNRQNMPLMGIPAYSIFTCKMHHVFDMFPKLVWYDPNATYEEHIKSFIQRRPFRLLDLNITPSDPKRRKQKKQIEDYRKLIEFLKEIDGK